MAKKYDVKTTATGVLFIDNKTNKVVDLDGTFVRRVSLVDALNANRQEISKRGELTDGSMSFMMELLQSPKLGSWAGKVAIGHSVPSGMKKSMRDVENDVIKPVFDADWYAKNPAPDAMDAPATFEYKAKLENEWRTYIEAMRIGGTYGQCKSASIQYLAYYGKLPCVYNADNTPDMDKIYRPSVILKMIANDMVRETGQLTGINKLLQDIQKLLGNSEVTEIEAKDAVVRALDIAKTLQAINDGFAQAATAKTQQLPTNAVDASVSEVMTEAIGKAARPTLNEDVNKARAEKDAREHDAARSAKDAEILARQIAANAANAIDKAAIKPTKGNKGKIKAANIPALM